jgi:hypothetical protein
MLGDQLKIILIINYLYPNNSYGRKKLIVQEDWDMGIIWI